MGQRRTTKDAALSGKSLIRAAVLAVLTEMPGHGWDVARRASRRMGSSWPLSDPKHIYPYLKRLEKAGLIRSKREPLDRPPYGRDVYSVTEEGEEARRVWRATPLEQGVVTTDLDVRLLFSTEEDIPDLLDRFAERRERLLEEIEDIAFTETPNVSYLARTINMHRASVERRLRSELEWLDDAQHGLELERDRLMR
jgi:DNA-binding PadR family transcriptional regulator